MTEEPTSKVWTIKTPPDFRGNLQQMPTWDTEAHLYYDIVASAEGIDLERRKEILGNEETTKTIAKSILDTLRCEAVEVDRTEQLN